MSRWVDLDDASGLELAWQALERRRAVRDIDPELRLAITSRCEHLSPEVAAPIIAALDEIHPALVLEIYFDDLTTRWP